MFKLAPCIACVGAVAIATAGQVGSASPYSGGWVLNIARSTFSSSHAHPKKIVWEIQQSGAAIKWTVTVVPEKGKIRYIHFNNDGNADFHKVDGSLDPTLGSATISDSGALKYVSKSPDPKQAVGGTSACSLSTDQETMTCDATRTNADGSTESQKLVFVRMSSRD